MNSPTPYDEIEALKARLMKSAIEDVLYEDGLHNFVVMETDEGTSIVFTNEKDRFLYNLKGGDKYYRQVVFEDFKELWRLHWKHTHPNSQE
jgi:hypothetical protein